MNKPIEIFRSNLIPIAIINMNGIKAVEKSIQAAYTQPLTLATAESVIDHIFSILVGLQGFPEQQAAIIEMNNGALALAVTNRQSQLEPTDKSRLMTIGGHLMQLYNLHMYVDRLFVKAADGEHKNKSHKFLLQADHLAAELANDFSLSHQALAGYVSDTEFTRLLSEVKSGIDLTRKVMASYYKHYLQVRCKEKNPDEIIVANWLLGSPFQNDDNNDDDDNDAKTTSLLRPGRFFYHENLCEWLLDGDASTLRDQLFLESIEEVPEVLGEIEFTPKRVQHLLKILAEKIQSSRSKLKFDVEKLLLKTPIKLGEAEVNILPALVAPVSTTASSSSLLMTTMPTFVALLRGLLAHMKFELVARLLCVEHNGSGSSYLQVIAKQWAEPWLPKAVDGLVVAREPGAVRTLYAIVTQLLNCNDERVKALVTACIAMPIVTTTRQQPLLLVLASQSLPTKSGEISPLKLLLDLLRLKRITAEDVCRDYLFNRVAAAENFPQGEFTGNDAARNRENVGWFITLLDESNVVYETADIAVLRATITQILELEDPQVYEVTLAFLEKLSPQGFFKIVDLSCAGLCKNCPPGLRTRLTELFVRVYKDRAVLDTLELATLSDSVTNMTSSMSSSMSSSMTGGMFGSMISSTNGEMSSSLVSSTAAPASVSEALKPAAFGHCQLFNNIYRHWSLDKARIFIRDCLNVLLQHQDFTENAVKQVMVKVLAGDAPEMRQATPYQETFYKRAVADFTYACDMCRDIPALRENFANACWLRMHYYLERRMMKNRDTDIVDRLSNLCSRVATPQAWHKVPSSKFAKVGSSNDFVRRVQMLDGLSDEQRENSFNNFYLPYLTKRLAELEMTPDQRVVVEVMLSARTNQAVSQAKLVGLQAGLPTNKLVNAAASLGNYLAKLF